MILPKDVSFGNKIAAGVFAAFVAFGIGFAATAPNDAWAQGDSVLEATADAVGTVLDTAEEDAFELEDDTEALVDDESLATEADSEDDVDMSIETDPEAVGDLAVDEESEEDEEPATEPDQEELEDPDPDDPDIDIDLDALEFISVGGPNTAPSTLDDEAERDGSEDGEGAAAASELEAPRASQLAEALDGAAALPVEPTLTAEDGRAASADGMQAQGDMSAQALGNPERHSQDDIRSFMNNHVYDVYAEPEYTSQPSTTQPYSAGDLTWATRENALAELNVMRYIAGVYPYVSQDSTYNDRAQTGAMVLAAIDMLTHHPSKPSGMSDSMFATGEAGTSGGNLASTEYVAASVSMYMSDSDAFNISQVGHRRWLLDDRMRYTGFGAARNESGNGYTVLYAHDGHYQGGKTMTHIAWPAANMPVGLFDEDDAWSVTYPEGEFAGDLEITLTRLNDGSTWYFSSGGSNGDFFMDPVIRLDKYSTRSTAGESAAIFRPSGIAGYAGGDSFRVDLYSASTGNSYSYTVDFFDLVEADKVSVSARGKTVKEGATISGSLFSGSISLSMDIGHSGALSDEEQHWWNESMQNAAGVWSSSDPSVASFANSYGRTVELTCHKKGTTTITMSYGGLTRTFKVKVIYASLANKLASVWVPYNPTYTGKAITPEINVSYDGKEMKKGTDYTVVIKNSAGKIVKKLVNAGTYTATVTGKGQVTGKKTVKFKVEPKQLFGYYSDETVTAKKAVYTGKAITPKVTVKLSDGTVLKQGTDFKVEADEAIEPGEYHYATVSGKGNYSGSTWVYFEITKANLSKATVKLEYTTTKYTGYSKEPNVTVKMNGKTLERFYDYDITYSNNKNVGTAKVKVSATTYTQYYTGSKPAPFKRTAASSSSGSSGSSGGSSNGSSGSSSSGSSSSTSTATTVKRLAGAMALDTMNKIVNAGGFAKGGTVVLTTVDGYWDALTAAGVAGMLKAPVLMTSGKSLSSQTKTQLQTLKPKRIIVCGGTAAVADSVANAAKKAAGATTRLRFKGNTATGTAIDIYNKVKSKKLGTWSTTAFVCTGEGYWDALAAAPVSYAMHIPIFLTESKSSISSATLKAMKDGGIKYVRIVGGTAAVSSSVAQRLSSYGFTVKDRLAGATAVETSEAVAKYGLSLGMKVNKLGVATTNGYWDALSGAALCGKNKAVMVLVSNSKSSSITSFIKSRASSIKNAFVFGGTAAVSEVTYNAVVKNAS